MPEWQMQFPQCNCLPFFRSGKSKHRSQHKHKHQQHVKQHIETKWQIFTPQLQSRIVDTIAFPEYRQSFYDINQYINIKLYDSHKTAAGHKCLKLPVKKFPPGSSRCIQRQHMT